jgi:cob(I)alamin adenosyltransferase
LIRINRVYTRSGDTGKTSLVCGTRVYKSNLQVHCYGEIDELNAILGCVRECINDKTQELHPVIEKLQQELFDIGSELATSFNHNYEGMWHVEQKHVTLLEQYCDKFGDGLPELTSFILPGGSKLAAYLHLARTVCRRAERSLVALLCEERQNKDEEKLNPELLKYCNRLSDLLFILSRWALKQENREPILWVQGK